jgi:hypothetical protein
MQTIIAELLGSLCYVAYSDPVRGYDSVKASISNNMGHASLELSHVE